MRGRGCKSWKNLTDFLRRWAEARATYTFNTSADAVTGWAWILGIFQVLGVGLEISSLEVVLMDIGIAETVLRKL